MSATFSSEYVLFTDLWGTTAKILNSEGTESYFSRADAPACQVHFRTGLTRLAEAAPEVEIIQAGDWAFARSADLEALLHFASALFKHMTLIQDEFVLWPIRAGIVHGSVATAGSSSLPNLQLSPVIGTALVEAPFLEKSAQRGMRLLVSKSIGEELSGPGTKNEFLVRNANTKGMEHYEINWMTPDRHTSGYLEKEIAGRALRSLLQERARALIEGNDNFYQQMGSSLNDLLRWIAKA